MLVRIMKKADSKLWAEATEAKFGCKAFRQLAVKDYIESGVNVEEKLRSIGLTEKTARRYYQHPNSSSNVRQQELMGPSTSGARKAPKVQDSDPESDSESDSDEEDSPGLSDDDTPEDDEEATAKTPKHKGVGKKSKN